MGKYMEINSKPKIILCSKIQSNETFPDNFYHRDTSYSCMITTREHYSAKIDNSWIARCDPWRIELPDPNLFRHVSQLVLDIHDQLSADSLTNLSSLIDLSQLNEMWLFQHDKCLLQPKTINILFEQALNLRTLGLWSSNDFIGQLENICSAISYRVDHLHIRLKQLHWIKLVFTCIKGVSIVTFEYEHRCLTSILDITKWLKQKRKIFSINEECKSIRVELDKNDKELSECKSNQKRIKITDDRYTS
ncbi:hypothetical protein I4U23_031075 [Adineta vaga]|nr:hypothetical protein I4U23_031075 [Adineta vaga]